MARRNYEVVGSFFDRPTIMTPSITKGILIYLNLALQLTQYVLSSILRYYIANNYYD